MWFPGLALRCDAWPRHALLSVTLRCGAMPRFAMLILTLRCVPGFTLRCVSPLALPYTALRCDTILAMLCGAGYATRYGAVLGSAVISYPRTCSIFFFSSIVYVPKWPVNDLGELGRQSPTPPSPLASTSAITESILSTLGG